MLDGRLTGTAAGCAEGRSDTAGGEGQVIGGRNGGRAGRAAGGRGAATRGLAGAIARTAGLRVGGTGPAGEAEATAAGS